MNLNNPPGYRDVHNFYSQMVEIYAGGAKSHMCLFDVSDGVGKGVGVKLQEQIRTLRRYRFLSYENAN